jgi:hypothetical protein
VDIHYKRRHFAKLLGLAEAELTAADKLSELKPLRGGPDSYQPRHLSAYRRVLDRHPGREPLRRQLFLNFKGGTGKTSLSVAYACRLAEMGHRVLLIDLDSQGHATSIWASRREPPAHDLRHPGRRGPARRRHRGNSARGVRCGPGQPADDDH